MRRLVPLTIFIFLLICSAYSQQLASWSSFHETGFVWNPAMTARFSQWEFSGTHRQEWIGFAGAPQISTISFQTPFYQTIKTSSSGGAYLERDRVGPFENYVLGLTYAYKFNPKFQRARDELSIGFSLKGSRFQFNRHALTLFDPGDGLSIITLDEDYQSFVPNLSLGIFYSGRNALENHYKSFIFGGISINQLAPLTALSIQQPNNTDHWDIRLKPHVLANIGYRYRQKGLKADKYFIESSLLSLITLASSVHAMASCRYEALNAWWISGGAVTNGDFFVQTGVIIDKHSKLKKIVKDGILRIGVKGDFHAGKIALFNRTGYEVYMAYTFEVER